MTDQKQIDLKIKPFNQRWPQLLDRPVPVPCGAGVAQQIAGRYKTIGVMDGLFEAMHHGPLATPPVQNDDATSFLSTTTAETSSAERWLGTSESRSLQHDWGEPPAAPTTLLQHSNVSIAHAPDVPVQTAGMDVARAVAESTSVKLDSQLQRFLSRLLGLRLGLVQIHTGQAADAVARKYGADALALENKILFRAGQFAPHSPQGVALLGHELTHIAQTADPAFVGRAYSAEGAEQQALANETRVLHTFAVSQTRTPPNVDLHSPDGMQRRSEAVQPVVERSQPPMRSISTSPAFTPAAQTVGSQSTGPVADRTLASSTTTAGSVPRAASQSRTLPLPMGPTRSQSETPALSAQQLRMIKEEVYRDLLDRLRTEAERGA